MADEGNVDRFPELLGVGNRHVAREENGLTGRCEATSMTIRILNGGYSPGRLMPG
jgi:hypothetical protein